MCTEGQNGEGSIRVSLPLPFPFCLVRGKEKQSFLEDNVDDDDDDNEGKKSCKKVRACRRAIPRDNVVPVLETGVPVRA